MQRLKRIILMLLYPHPLIVLAVSVVSFGSMIAAAIFLGSESPLTIVTYVLSAYSLTVICLRIPAIISFFKRIRQENALVARWFEDDKFRVKTSLYVTITMNLLYTVLQFGLAIYHSSVWYYTLGAYYLILLVLNFLLMRGVKYVGDERYRIKELKRYRTVGIALLPLNMTLMGMVIYITKLGYGVKHHFITTIGLAAFTFFSFTMAIIGQVRYAKYNSPVYSAAKVLSLVSSSVSVLSLETAMLYAFGEETDELFRTVITNATGTAICIITVVLSIFMLIKVDKQLKTLRIEGQINGTEQ
ncbi:MAG: hypothetical protein IKC87_04600 [Clostridia bacterium]|nr:hypothetical protein [Clostridia bacterium]